MCEGPLPGNVHNELLTLATVTNNLSASLANRQDNQTNGQTGKQTDCLSLPAEVVYDAHLLSCSRHAMIKTIEHLILQLSKVPSAPKGAWKMRSGEWIGVISG